jgi:hypothetical protein
MILVPGGRLTSDEPEFALAMPPARDYQAGMRAQNAFVLFTCLACLAGSGCGPSAPSTPLHQAVQDLNYPAVRQHIAAHSDLNAKDKSGWTALHLAVMKGDLPMVQLLANGGADLKRTGPNGKTPVQVAREKGLKPVVQYLEARLNAPPAEPTAQAGQEKPGRRLIDGGVGVSEVLDAR